MPLTFKFPVVVIFAKVALPLVSICAILLNVIASKCPVLAVLNSLPTSNKPVPAVKVDPPGGTSLIPETLKNRTPPEL